MLLKGIALILHVAGSNDTAVHIPGCTDTVYSFLDIDTTTFLILPICPKCNNVYPHNLTSSVTCLCCDIWLYPQDPEPPQGPKLKCHVHVPTYKLTMLLLLAQIKAFLNVEGVEVDMDWWHSVGQPHNVYTDVTSG